LQIQLVEFSGGTSEVSSNYPQNKNAACGLRLPETEFFSTFSLASGENSDASVRTFRLLGLRGGGVDMFLG
ncbi:MAG: hypothetical protein WAM66_12115, partial [Acidobacteriaceae bacterium]